MDAGRIKFVSFKKPSERHTLPPAGPNLAERTEFVSRRAGYPTVEKARVGRTGVRREETIGPWTYRGGSTRRVVVPAAASDRAGLKSLDDGWQKGINRVVVRASSFALKPIPKAVPVSQRVQFFYFFIFIFFKDVQQRRNPITR